ncbi:hypothetical protein DFH08DRAFT_964353 [Mycena albidolilacea]|uniref:Secreted protein n=1 Tax=Mycena albidolilacea TaxID=1033008 RepID=A0AAD7ENB4_9AGAR|nr:hypothetical protein DFH08DRAFT_964353 [Mycena albidolilacea]
MADEAGAACCGICLLCGFGALSTWCNMNAFGGRGGRHTGCCGRCCNDSFNEDSMDRWDKDRAELRETAQPEGTAPMAIPPSGPAPGRPSESEPINPTVAPGISETHLK